MENHKIQNFKCDIFGDFQTLVGSHSFVSLTRD